TFTNDELRIFRRPLITWRKRNAVTGKMEVINNTYHVWLNAEEGSVRSLPVGNHLSSQKILRCKSSVLAKAVFLILFLSQIACRSNHFLRLHGSHSSTPGYKPLHSALPVTPTLLGERLVLWTV